MQTSVKSKCPPGLEMSAHILTSGYWPSYPVLDAKLPAELTQYQVKTVPVHPLCCGVACWPLPCDLSGFQVAGRWRATALHGH